MTAVDSPSVLATVDRSAADRFMRRLLRVEHAPTATAAEARKAFQTSVLVSAIRCTLMYLVFPFLLPALGIAAGVGPVIGAVIGAIAIVCIVASMRRFWRADHRARWTYTIFGGAIIIALLVFNIIDIARTFG
jgi:hypothetical protein